MSTAELVLLFGGTRITIMENYEALGRYISARETAEKLATERNRKLDRLKTLISRASGMQGSSYLAADFDVALTQQLVADAAELHQNMLAAINEANIHADNCGRSKLQIFSMND